MALSLLDGCASSVVDFLSMGPLVLYEAQSALETPNYELNKEIKTNILHGPLPQGGFSQGK